MVRNSFVCASAAKEIPFAVRSQFGRKGRILISPFPTIFECYFSSANTATELRPNCEWKEWLANQMRLRYDYRVAREIWIFFNMLKNFGDSGKTQKSVGDLSATLATQLRTICDRLRTYVNVVRITFADTFALVWFQVGGSRMLWSVET